MLISHHSCYSAQIFILGASPRPTKATLASKPPVGGENSTPDVPSASKSEPTGQSQGHSQGFMSAVLSAAQEAIAQKIAAASECCLAFV